MRGIRIHPQGKRRRTVENLRLAQRRALGGSLLFAGLSIAAAMGPGVAAVVFAYLVGTLAYSFRLKRVPILDVGMLASLFTLRLFLGVVAIGAVISPWLFVFSMALFLSLSIAKRHTEVVRMRAHGETKTAGRGYLSSDEPMLLAFGAVATGGALVLLVMYLMAEAFRAGFYSFPSALWAMPVVLFLWLGRIWLLCGRGELDDDPVAFALRDAPSRLLGLAMGAVFAFATFGGAVL
jgi:4-hydroxybenzoate polyprenyltransferase